MGNVALCAPSIIPNGGVKIFSGTDGKLAIYTKAPVKAADVMLENPGRFLCEPDNLRVGQRVTGMCADEELERGRAYLLLPMEMLHSVLTDQEMRILTQKASKGSRQGSLTSLSKIFPDFICLFTTHIGGSPAADHGSGSEDGESVRYSRQRSWQPALETIVETPPRA